LEKVRRLLIAKVARKMGCIERRVTYFRKFFKTNKKKFSFRQVQS